ncbi:polyribonucleotide nucleotidyltransferase [Capnocytophaga haemolytica]|uniref:Polyribonucleotide nucleotidyltransferase n=1 Tax=Capnocytophaga haemolytica TaxID=45243 RepID=A0AAX2GV38_9FLAO|nr:polyribonucleotide nucleotidyltransferase [Capnocytophaga haemolytica]AMD85204.1 polyribonucleotide nucleotidyltransferase [Capnocytophaga haemolytica]SFN64720.1 polyribonucleotide nucleotidyltransferase [Capnocytophaga haemolytica]SNV04234.1 Polyribonucleotide nucleotidyltransferase [Capnocytophaga haemolytica]
MIPEPKREIIELGDGRTISIETGKLAKQADGSVVVRMGNAMLLATVVSAREINPETDFLPLTVDYREKFAAAGRFPGGFFKREARPSDQEILTMRLVDRVLRPLFPKDYHAETQVMIQLISHDENVMPDALAGLAASAAIAVSDIPFAGPISEVRVGRVGGQFVVNPSKAQLEESDIDIMVGASRDFVAMVEGEMDEVSEKDMAEAIKFAHEAIKSHIDAQLRLAEKVGVPTEKRAYEPEVENEEVKAKVYPYAYDKCYAIAKEGTTKQERGEKFAAVLDECLAFYTEEEQEELAPLVKKYFGDAEKEAVRRLILDEGIRLDGRNTTQIRPIWCEIDYLPSAHGSSIFTRGETQSLTTVTLGTSREANVIDLPTEQGEERFYLHYNFPPFSTGEARPLRGTSRREIGHGNLAQRALKRMVPEDCPYTVRVVSEILESNGSSSMATVCAGTLALMDAGVQMIKPVSGIAMGLITDGDKYAVLSDILGDEDHLGDMDFKVTGTKDGITACQMDIKIKGLTYEILEKALEQAREGRMHILGKITDTIDAPKPTVKPHAPKIVKMEMPKEYIGAFIGTGGKNIQDLQARTETTIVVEEVGEFGIVEILGTNEAGIQEAIEAVKAVSFEPVEGETYTVTVTRLLEFGAVVEFMPGKDTLLHISEVAWERTDKIEDVLKEGDVLEVKYLGIDPKTKKSRVSRKALLPRPPREDRPERSDRPREDRPRGGHNGKPRSGNNDRRHDNKR